MTPGFTDAELDDAALAYNAFEKLRDPSHGRCLGMAEWSDVLTDKGFEIAAKERLPKDMEFQPWAERMGCDPATVSRLRDMLTGGTPALKRSSGRARKRASSGLPWTRPSSSPASPHASPMTDVRVRAVLLPIADCLSLELLTRVGYKPGYVAPPLHRDRPAD